MFLKDTFPERGDLADAVNRLLVTGFFMLNLGYAFFLMQADISDEPGRSEATRAFEVLAQKLGLLLVSLAVIHFVNLAVFHRIGGRRRQRLLPPPAAPQTTTQPFPAAFGQ